MNSKALRIPLSVAAAGVLAFGFDISLNSDEWQLVGSGKGVDVQNLVGEYLDTAGSGCANNAVISAWRFVNDGSTTTWQTRNCYVDTETLGYTLLTNTNGYEGMWVHASSTGGDVTANDVDADDATEITVYDGWNMLANGDDAITFASQTQYGIFKDTTNSVKVYRYTNGAWEVYSPNGLSGSYTAASGLNANEGYWVYVDSGKTYSTSLTSGNSSNNLDNNSNYLGDSPIDLGGDDVNITDEVAANAGKKFEFETDIFSSTTYTSTDANASTAATMLDQNLSNLLTELNASSPTDYKVNPVLHTLVAQAQTLYNRVSAKGYISSSIKLQAGTAKGLSEDLNNSINEEIRAPGVSTTSAVGDLNTSYDVLNLAGKYATQYDDTNLSLYGFFSLDTNLTAQQKALNALSRVQTYYEMAKTSYDAAVATGGDADDIVTAAESLYTLLYDANASQPTGVAVSTSTERVKTVNETNQTVSFIAGLDRGGNDGTDYELYRFSLVVPSVGTFETDLNATFGLGLWRELNDTIRSNTSFTSYLYVSGENASEDTTAAPEMNITGQPGVGAFTISLASLNNDSNTTNDWSASNTGISDYDDLNLTTNVEYIAPVTGVRKVVKVTVDKTFTAGDEFNITGGELDDKMKVGTGIENFWDDNITFTLDSADIKSTSTLTQYHVATRLAQAIDGNETNLTASASGNVVTITTSTLAGDSADLLYDGNITGDDNGSVLATADFDLEIQVNGIDYNTMLTEAEALRETAYQMETNLTAIVSDEDNGTNVSFKSITTALLYASDTLDTVVNGTASSANAGTVYTDNYARLYWDLEGVTSATGCTSSNINALQGWRLPTISDVISLYDMSTGKIVSTISGASVTSSATNIFADNGTYILTSNTDSTGDYYAVNVSDVDDVITDDGTGSSGETVNISCVADFYDNDNLSASTQFHDYYYYTDLAGTTNRLTKNSSSGYVEDAALGVNWYLAQSTAQWSPMATDGKVSTWSNANSWCSALGYQLPTLAQLRSLNLYDIKARYDNVQATMGLNRSDMFSVDFNDSSIGYWTQSTDGSGNYYVVSPTMDVNYTNMAGWTSSATADGDGYRVICVKAQ